VTADLDSLALVAQRTVNAVVITDARKRIVWVNPAFERVTGYSSDEVMGRSPGELLQFEGTDPKTVVQLREALDAGRSFAGEILNRGKFGNEYWLELDIQPLRDASGAVTGFMAVQMDVTARRKTEEEARRSAALLRRALEVQAQFIATVSHELRTPLQTINGFSDLGRVFAAPHPELQALFGEIHAGGLRMLKLVNGLLDVSKIDGTLGSMDLKPADVVALTAEVSRELATLAAERALRITLPPALPRLLADVDSFRLQQVLRNVLANAIRFAPAGSAIELGFAQWPDAGTDITVRDHGPGIPPAELEAIFEPFVQSSRTRDGSGGTGLGLAISRKIMAAHGGTLAADNADGGGALMRIHLPAHKALNAAGVAVDIPDNDRPLPGWPSRAPLA
jgi:PAS domain S-box-containing protein